MRSEPRNIECLDAHELAVADDAGLRRRRRLVRG
jgi:hypothetical protein